MRLVSWESGFGRVEGDEVVPLGDDLLAWLETGEEHEGAPVPLASLALAAPIARPGKIVCVGRNYRAHAAEREVEAPSEPIFFAKFANSIVGPDATVPLLRVSDEIDWEAELVAVIGRRAFRVPQERALEHVAGYTCGNDLTARDLQKRGGQWTRGKAVDGFLPLGPALVTADEVGDPQALRISCALNGEIVQDASTAEMIFPVAELVATLSETMTLEPGDLIATGTPAGIGAARTPPRFLRPGDELVVEVERVGALRTTMGPPL